MSIYIWAMIAGMFVPAQLSDPVTTEGKKPVLLEQFSSSADLLACDCNITQSGNTYAISALQGNVNPVAFYSYGNPNISSANTGLELTEGLVIFLYEDINTGIISLFLIADNANDATGGDLEFEVNCLPQTAFVSVEDDPGEFFGAPPLITGDWFWASCCTDGGVIEDIGCNNTINLDLLVANGIDSIVWLTGDINNPDQILLNLSGESITISCGTGGICCPVGLDTEVVVVDATCPDTPNGSIDLTPQDGFPGYTFLWGDGSTAQNQQDLYSGVYNVTVTDSQGCTEELSINVGTSPGDPDAQSSSLTLCSENATALFNLTELNEIINLGTGFSVLWFQNENLTGPIGDPTNYFSSTSTVYAVVDNEFCISEPVPVELTVIQSPIGTSTTINQCEETNGMATFDLTSIDQEVSGGVGTVSWYLDPELNSLINNPSNFLTGSVTVYAVITDDICSSEPVEVELIVDPKPLGMSVSTHLCGDENDEAVFDLIALEDVVSMGNGSITWFLEIELIDEIFNPGSFNSPTATVYAVVFDGVCNSDPIPVELIVDPTPVGNAILIVGCDEGSGYALFNLWDYDNLVSGGEGAVEWYLDEFLSDPITDPGGFYSQSTIIFATVDNDLCVSGYVEIEIIVEESPEGDSTSIESCADLSGFGVFNLVSAELEISGGIGTILWYQDPFGEFPISNPTAYLSTGEIVYAQITLGNCISEFIPIELTIITSVTAMSASLSACDDGTGQAIFNLVSISNMVSGGTGQVNWFIDMAGTQPILNPSAFYSGDSIVYANVSAGDCVSDMVAIDLSVVPSPSSNDITVSFCGDVNGETIIDLTQLDTLVGGQNGDVTWYSDMLLIMEINNPNQFSTSDTLLFATVSDGNCSSPPAEINIQVTAGLTANPQLMELCIPAGETLLIDLTQSDQAVSGGAGQVTWYSDSMATLEIIVTSAYPVSITDTVYAGVSDGECTSPLVPIELSVLEAPIAQTTDIKKCGDANGQVTVDLTTVDAIVSNGTGVVTWYADANQMILLNNPTMLTTGDTTIYAVTTNGFCVSPITLVTVTVVDSLLAAPQQLAFCVLDNDTATIDLTQYNLSISGGSGPVIWFNDSLMTDTIFNPSAFVTAGDSLYAIVTADGCISNIALVTVEVASSSYPTPDCAYTSIDSVSISWPDVADQYEISYLLNGLPMGSTIISSLTEFNIGGLAQNDSITLFVTSLYNSICTQPLTTTIICATDICPPRVFSFGGLKPEYCKDEDPVELSISPGGGVLSGEGISGDTLYPAWIAGSSSTITYTWEDASSGCLYDTTVVINFYDPLPPPNLICASDTISAVSFSWDNAAASYGYTYTINQGVPTSVVVDNKTSLMVDGLNEGDEVTLTLWAIGSLPCGNSDTVTASCISKLCPPASIDIADPGSFCSVDDPVLLEAMISGLSGMETLIWSGSGITDPGGRFDPKIASFGTNTISLEVSEEGCFYTSAIDLIVYQQPIADFDIFGVSCINLPFNVEFFGTASDTANFIYDLDGANIVSGNPPYNFSIAWPTPGSHSIELTIDDQGCISNSIAVSFDIDAPLTAPEIICMEEDYTSIIVEWEPVPGALSYSVTSSDGTGVLFGTTYAITDLQDDSPVTITVTPVGGNECASTSSSIVCQTLAYIPAQVFVPNVFSPNFDGVNDVFFIQSNTEVSIVTSFRIYDRWGNVVFEDFNFPVNDPAHGWDGMVNEEMMNPAVFTYIAEVQTNGGESLILKGDVTLVR